jgi:hypothetical protein
MICWLLHVCWKRGLCLPVCRSVCMSLTAVSCQYLEVPGGEERHDIPRCPVACRQRLFFVTQHAAFTFTADSLLGRRISRNKSLPCDDDAS